MPALILLAPLAIIAVSIPLILGVVPRNHWYGFRTSRTLSSDATWYRSNRIGGKYFVIAGLIQLIAIAIVRLVWPAQATQLTATYGGIWVTVPLLIAVVLWFVRTRRI